jgi:hypothetical protein
LSAGKEDNRNAVKGGAFVPLEPRTKKARRFIATQLDKI